MINLLLEPVFSARQRAKRLTLPGVLEALGSGEALEFSAIQPHQQHAWHAFLVHLAAYALVMAGRKTPDESEESWEGILLSLTREESGPWTLITETQSPAFMQPPDTDKDLRKWVQADTPSSMDLLVPAKNHDIKMDRMIHAQAEHWAYSLVTLQTMQGVTGRGHYGISRMNAGFGNRPCVSLVPSDSTSERFVRDVMLLLKHRSRLLREYQYTDRGLALLWLKSWDGKTSLSPATLDPFYIDVCHRVRMAKGPGDRLVAKLAPSTTTRVAANGAKGNTGDLWTPLRGEDKAALTVNARGFTYDVVNKILFEDVLPASFDSLSKKDVLSTIFLQALARGRGKTEGFHERRIEVPSEFAEALRSEKTRSQLKERVETRAEYVKTFALRILKPALLCAMQGAPDRIKFDDNRADGWISEFYRGVDKVFFSHFFSVYQQSAEDGNDSWALVLLEIAEPIFKQVLNRILPGFVHRYRVIAVAERVFYGGLCNQLPAQFKDMLRQDEQEKQELPPLYPLVHTMVGVLMHQRSARDLALLRRMAIDGPRIQAFTDMIPDLSDYSPRTERQWVIVVRTLAILSNGQATTHRPRFSLGRALAFAAVSETRLWALLRARDPEIPTVLFQIARQLVMRSSAFDHAELAELVLSNHHLDPLDDGVSRREKIRRKISSDFYSSIRKEG